MTARARSIAGCDRLRRVAERWDRESRFCFGAALRCGKFQIYLFTIVIYKYLYFRQCSMYQYFIYLF